MRLVALCVLASSIVSLSALPSRAEFLLNCRLMDRHDRLYEHYCFGDQDSFLVVAKCSEHGLCVIKKQNFKGAYYSGKNASGRLVAELGDTAQVLGAQTGLPAVNSALSAADSVRNSAADSVGSLAGQ
jgi:hypothetical protein